jgi:uncharacterized membrane protein
MSTLEILRIIFGGLFVLFVPGFAWSFIFFPKGKIDWIERITLSFGLSIALVPLSVFWLNWLFHVGIDLLNTTLIVLGLTVIPIFYILISRSTWGKNVATSIKSVFKHEKGK